LHGCDNIGGTGTGSNENNTGLARGTGVTLSHVTGTLFVLGEEEFEMLGVVNGVKDGKNSTTGVTNYMKY
jgi:hypothetical protein